MDSLLTITWDFGKGLDFGFYTLRIYSLLFALGFVFGYQIIKKIFIKEKISLDKLESLVVYMVVATIVGARLGHVFFYQWDYYSLHPSEILMVWKGGLASHGAAIAIIVSAYLFSKRVFKDTARTLWILDRLVIVVALAAALIRLGNWFNSEIYGDMGNSALETVFTEPTRERLINVHGENIESISFENTGKVHETDSLNMPIYRMNVQYVETQLPATTMVFAISQSMRTHLNNFDREERNIIIPDDAEVKFDESKFNLAYVEVYGVPRHPTQLYEAFGYLIIFMILFFAFHKASMGNKKGFLFGAFLVMVFGFRFFIEYLKENQVAAEQGQLLNIGQYLSIPLVLVGLFFMVKAKGKKINEKG